MKIRARVRLDGDEQTAVRADRTSIINNDRATTRKYVRDGNEHSLSARRLHGVARSNMRVSPSPSPLQFIRQFDVSINLSLPPVDPNFR